MIRVLNYFPEECAELNLMTQRYVNSVLQQIVLSNIEMHKDATNCFPEETSYILEAICPRTMLRDDSQKCENKLLELYDLICSKTIRKTIHPIYKYILFHCIENDLDFGLKDTQELCPFDVSLVEEIKHQFGEEAENYIGSICDIESYLEHCFSDWDFLPEFVNEITNLSMSVPGLFQIAMSYEELDEYVDIMDADLRDEYLQYRARMKNLALQEDDETRLLIHDVFRSLCTIQRNPIYIGRSEDEINDGIRDMLRFSWEVYDQTRQGKSESGKSAGEVDFVFSNNGMEIALAEALKMDSMDELQLSRHITKAIDNYNPNGYPIIFLLLYVVAKDFKRFWERCIAFLQTYDYSFPILSEIEELELPYTESRQARIIIERSGKPVAVHFFAVHMKG